MISKSILTSNGLTEELLNEIKEMIEIRGADANATDFSGKNALHYLAKFSSSVPKSSDNPVEFEMKVVEQAKLQNRYYSS